MGRKINLIILVSAIIIVCSGCADFELHLKKEVHGTRPSIILIGSFDCRNMNYDPYVSDDFKDALKLEFFKRGYNPVVIQKGEASALNGPEWAAKICRDNAGDILINGVISQRESGFLADRTIETLISFTIYGKNGAILGEGFYHDNESAGDESLRRGASDYFVSELIKNIEQAD